MKLILILVWTIFFSCNNHSPLNIEYPVGGYDFPKTTISNKDFSCYPLIDKISRRDSFFIAYEDYYFFHSFKEPNISLKPSRKAMFRLTYQGFDTCYVITLTEDEMIVKTGYGRYMPELDFSKLTELENKHYKILLRDFPLDEPKPNRASAPPSPADAFEEEIRSRKIIDSIKNNTPELLNPTYFKYLLKKAEVQKPFNFSIKKIKITKGEFMTFINLLNQSGFWEIRYDPKCRKEYITEYYDFALEANTGEKYNYVGNAGRCDTLSLKFFEARRELFRLANVEKRWQQY